MFSLQQFHLLLNETVEKTDPVNLVRREYDRKIKLLEQRINQGNEKIAELDVRLAKAESSWESRISSWIRRILRKN